MGIKIFYIVAIIYAVLSALGIIQRALGPPYWYIFAALLVVYYGYYWHKARLRLVNSIVGMMLANVFVQLTGGVNSPLFYFYIAILGMIGYRESPWHYWLIGVTTFGVELFAAIFRHSVQVPPLLVFALSLIVYQMIFYRSRVNEAYLKKSLIKFEAQSSFLAPAAFERKAIITDDKMIDSHGAVERPLLFLAKFIHRILEAHTTALLAYHSDHLTMIYGISESELFRSNIVVESTSGIYRQVISTQRSLLITEFSQDPEELGYYRGELQISSVMVAPLMVGGRFEGLLVIDRKAKPLEEADRTLLEDAAKALSLMLAIMRQYETEYTKAKHLDAIANMAERLHKGFDLSRILNDAMSTFREVMQCDDITVAEIDELNAWGKIIRSSNIKPDTMFNLDEGLVGMIVKHRQFLKKDDVREGDQIIFKKGCRTRNHAFLGVPVQQEDNILAVIWCEDHRKGRFLDDDVMALEILASQLSLVWQRAVHHELEKEKAARDGLTGLYNHRQFQEILGREIAGNKELVLLMLDIDYFKKINDTYGHQGGDRVIKFLGNLISKTGISARYGGEEFAIILPKYSLKKGMQQAVEIKDHILKSEIRLDQVRIKITVSIGVAHFPSDGTTREELIARADQALYQAKNRGRDRVMLAATMNSAGSKADES